MYAVESGAITVSDSLMRVYGNAEAVAHEREAIQALVQSLSLDANEVVYENTANEIEEAISAAADLGMRTKLGNDLVLISMDIVVVVESIHRILEARIDFHDHVGRAEAAIQRLQGSNDG